MGNVKEGKAKSGNHIHLLPMQRFTLRLFEEEEMRNRWFSASIIVSLYPNFNQEVMGRVLAIDYGQKRVGIAVTDILQITANGLTTVPVSQIFDFLTNYFAVESVDIVVIGLPKQMNNQPSDSMRFITPFVNGFKKRFPDRPMIMYDERFTSVLAHQAMIDGGLKKKERQNKALVDQISATILLQSYLESKR